MGKRVVIIGAGAAGCTAAAYARKYDRKAEITIVDKEPYIGYSRCGLTFVLEGVIDDFQDLIVYTPQFLKMNKIEYKIKSEVLEIDLTGKTISIASSGVGNEEVLGFDALILATGARSFIPPIEGIDKDNVFQTRTIDDWREIKEFVKKRKNSQGVIIGGGLVGLEAASALSKKGIKVTVVEMLPQILSQMLDPDMAKEVETLLKKDEISLLISKKVGTINGEKKVESVSIDGEEIPADFAVLAVGVKPNVEIAKSFAKIGEGIRVDEKMNVLKPKDGDEPIPNVYACGDCAEVKHQITGEWVTPLLGSSAVRQGKIAGINAVGGSKTFPGVLISAVTKIFDLEIGAVGLTENTAKKAGINPVKQKIVGETRAHYYPGGKKTKVKLLAEPKNTRIIGAQIVGGEGVAQTINTIAIAIQKNATASDLENIDTCYSPPLSDYIPPWSNASELITKKLERSK